MFTRNLLNLYIFNRSLNYKARIFPCFPWVVPGFSHFSMEFPMIFPCFHGFSHGCSLVGAETRTVAAARGPRTRSGRCPRNRATPRLDGRPWDLGTLLGGVLIHRNMGKSIGKPIGTWENHGRTRERRCLSATLSMHRST